jgi:hypothetical protein
MTIVTGKHKEYLIELMLYYIGTQRKKHGIKIGVDINDIIQENKLSDYWVKELIDAPTVLHYIK